PPRPRPALAVPAPSPPAAAAVPRQVMPAPRRDLSEEPILSAIPIATHEVVTAELVTAAATVAPFAPAAQPVTAARPASRAALPMVRRAPGPPRPLVQMLRNPQSLAPAIVLREVLEPPLVRRRRGR